MDDFDPPTQTDSSAPLVDYDSVSELTNPEPVRTVPETRNAARAVLAREAAECRRTRVVRDGTAPLRRSTSVPVPTEPKAVAISPYPECGSVWRTTISGPAGWRVAMVDPILCVVDLVAYDGTACRNQVSFYDLARDYRFDETPPRAPAESRSLTSAPGDMKAGLTSSRPKLSIVPAAGELYQCRAMEYGADKYARGNYHNGPPAGVTPAARVMGYVDAALRHLRAVADAYNRESPVAQGPASLTFGAALAAQDTVASGGFPASGLPHLAHAMASVALAIQCGVDDSLLPDDPGQPWKNGEVTEDRSPEAAARFGAR